MTFPVPMQALYQRIDQVRSERPDLPIQLRSIAEEMPRSSTRNTLLKLAAAVENKVPADQIAARFPRHCWLLTLQSSAATTDALTAILEQSAFQHNIQRKRIRAIAYPVILVAIAAAMVLVACALLVPPFDEMYQEFAFKLPPQTVALINLSRLVTGHPIAAALLVLLASALVAGLLWFWISDNPIKQQLFGDSLNRFAARQSLAKAALQLAELSDEGVPLERALRISAESTATPTLRSVLADLAIQAMQDPSQLRRTRAAAFLPPNFLMALYSPAQHSSALPSTNPQSHSTENDDRSPANTTMLRELAANYRDLSIRRKDWGTFILGQLAIVGVGFIIAFIVISLFAPMVSLVSALSS
ncbi:hypothetical protein NHH03_20955 [Stieleria sp. TO1_6]|uniref:hypothetical protein n=1 Tax=Stieleria tagensis TaxID=2956795 RepID=UPI00209B2EC4|nr:hypothetical protein [Stieleria tagensis]MCO8124225.1 hypothetical protein [Stieleria tagensis]